MTGQIIGVENELRKNKIDERICGIQVVCGNG